MAEQNNTDKKSSLNFESFACFWLDKNVNSSEDNRKAKAALRTIINHLQTFSDKAQCESIISETSNEKVILIVSGSFGKELVPRLHNLHQLSACYVYCADKATHEKWTKDYYKVKGVFDKLKELITKISKDQTAREQLEEGSSISILSKGSESLESRNAIFMWFQLFIEVLLRMHHKSSDRNELLDLCKSNYKENLEQMRILNEFEKNYKRENSIWWYTRESCFYKMLNKALRIQDYDTLFAFRFFITDLAGQIASKHEDFIRNTVNREMIRVYRGQQIESTELELMKRSIGHYLSMNSFLSTSQHRNVAVQFIEQVPVGGNLQRIIFEIDIDPRKKTKAFADIIDVSYFKKEKEVLIMLGALFRIESISEDKTNRVWVARLSLASEDDFQLKDTFSHMKEKIGDDTNLISLGKILFEMGEYEQAQKCYERMLTEANLTISDTQQELGWTLMKLEKYESSLNNLNQALKIRIDILGEEHSKVGEVYRGIGGVYWSEDEYEQAFEYTKKAVEILEKASPRDVLNLSKAYMVLGVICSSMGNLKESLRHLQKTLQLQQEIYPETHPQIALTYNNIGCSYRDLEERQMALNFYKKSLEISRKILPPSHPDVVRTENNIQALETEVSD